MTQTTTEAINDINELIARRDDLESISDILLSICLTKNNIQMKGGLKLK